MKTGATPYERPEVEEIAGGDDPIQTSPEISPPA